MNMLSPVDLDRGVGSPVGPQPEALPFAWVPLAGGFLRRRAAAIILVASMVTGLALLYVSQLAPTYMASATLLVDQRRADNFQAAHTTLDSLGVSAQIESQVEVLRSFGLAAKVVDRLNLADLRTDMAPGAGLIAHRVAPLKTAMGLGRPAPSSDSADVRAAQAADTVSRMITVRRVGLTFIIEVSVVAEDPQAAAKLANAVTDVYVAEQLGAKSQATHEASDWLHARIGELSAQATAADAAVQKYKKDHNIVATDEGLINEQQLTALTAKLATLRAATIAAKAQLARAKLMLSGGDTSGAVMGEGLQSGIIDNLRQKLIDKQRQYAEWRVRFGAQHEVVRRLEAEIGELQAGIRGEMQRIVGTATNSVEIAQASENATQAQVDAVVDQSGRVNSDRVQLRALQSEAETYRTLYTNFLQRYTQAAQDQSFPVSEVQVVSAAAPPLLRSGPKRGLIVGGAGVVGLGLGLLVGLVAEIASQRPRARPHGRSARGLECLGTLPLLGAEPSGWKGPAEKLRSLVVGGNMGAMRLPDGGGAGLLRLGVDRPNELFGLAVAGMRREVLRRLGTSREGRVIGCLTLNSGEGTSTVAANLAHALALGGHRTVLVDMADGPGNLTRLMGQQDGENDGLGGRMHQDRKTGLLFRPAIRPAGLPSNNAVTISQSMSAMVKALQRKHDFVILDLPAVERRMPSHDILTQVDDLLMVGAWTEQDEAKMLEVPDLAAASAVRCLGIVLTMVPPRFCDVV